jgi:hypothetical protein
MSPPVPVRQWVLSLPFGLRYRVAYDPAMLVIYGIFARTVFAFMRKMGRDYGIHQTQCGAVSFVQRFGGALNLNPQVTPQWSLRPRTATGSKDCCAMPRVRPLRRTASNSCRTDASATGSRPRGATERPTPFRRGRHGLRVRRQTPPDFGDSSAGRNPENPRTSGPALPGPAPRSRGPNRGHRHPSRLCPMSPLKRRPGSPLPRCRPDRRPASCFLRQSRHVRLLPPGRT